MIWADFWSTVEPNLGILCVSLPMLGRLRSRFTSRRGASKLEGRSSDGPGSYRDGTKQSGRVAAGRSRQDEAFGLETLYASNQEVHHESGAVANSKLATVPSRDGSEEALAPVPGRPSMDKKGILVETKWTISST